MQKFLIQFPMNKVNKLFVSWANHACSDLHEKRFRVPVKKEKFEFIIFVGEFYKGSLMETF